MKRWILLIAIAMLFVVGTLSWNIGRLPLPRLNREIAVLSSDNANLKDLLREARSDRDKLDVKTVELKELLKASHAETDKLELKVASSGSTCAEQVQFIESCVKQCRAQGGRLRRYELGHVELSCECESRRSEQ